jgi:hypothetical protein
MALHWDGHMASARQSQGWGWLPIGLYGFGVRCAQGSGLRVCKAALPTKRPRLKRDRGDEQMRSGSAETWTATIPCGWCGTYVPETESGPAGGGVRVHAG